MFYFKKKRMFYLILFILYVCEHSCHSVHMEVGGPFFPEKNHQFFLATIWVPETKPG